MPKHVESAGLGVMVREARLRSDLTQQQLGDILGVDKGYVSAIETGVRRWPLEYIEGLAEVLGLDLIEMAIAAGMLPETARRTRSRRDDYAPGDPTREILDLLDRMDNEARLGVLDYVRFLMATRAEADATGSVPAEAVRQRLAGELGISRVPPRLWKVLTTDGYVEGAIRHPDAGWADLIDEAKRLHQVAAPQGR